MLEVQSSSESAERNKQGVAKRKSMFTRLGAESKRELGGQERKRYLTMREFDKSKVVPGRERSEIKRPTQL